MQWRASGYLFAYFTLIFTLPFIFDGLRYWRLVLGRSPGFPIPRAEGQVVVLSHGDRRVRNGIYHDFDLVDSLDRIADHPCRLLKDRPGHGALRIRKCHDAGPEDVRCSVENAHKRDRLLHSAQDFKSKIEPACGPLTPGKSNISAFLDIPQQDESAPCYIIFKSPARAEEPGW